MPDIFAGEEFLPLLGVDDLGEDRLLALGRELDGVFRALDALLDEAPLLDLVDVHVLEADVAAVGLLKHLDDLAHRRLLEPEHAANPDRPVEVGRGETVICRGEVGRDFARASGRADRGRPRGARARDRCGSASSRGC